MPRLEPLRKLEWLQSTSRSLLPEEWLMGIPQQNLRWVKSTEYSEIRSVAHRMLKWPIRVLINFINKAINGRPII